MRHSAGIRDVWWTVASTVGSVLGAGAPLRDGARRVVVAVTSLLLVSGALAEPTWRDDFESLEGWRVAPSDGVTGEISIVDGQHGKALRLDFNFQSGAGFCVLRRKLDLPLPQNYRFMVGIRGDAPPNNLEFKLVDPSGDNVWWVNRRGFEFPREWQTLSQRARQFRFAWGPSGGKRLDAIGAIEVAVAASSGGKGYIVLDDLTFEALPEPRAASGPPTVSFSSQRAGTTRPAAELPDSGAIGWVSGTGDEQLWLQLDFGQMRELGGLALDWDTANYPTALDILYSNDAQTWELAAHIDDAGGGRSYVPLKDTEARAVRIAVQRASSQQGVVLHRLRVLGPEFSESPNAMFAAIAREAPRGRFPRYLLGEAPYWTIIGVPSDEREALLDTDGALEVDKASFRLEPFLHVGDRLVTWADARVEPALLEDYLPIPSITWSCGDLQLTITALADGTAGESVLVAQYRLQNRGAERIAGSFFLALRPFQVLPPWQELNVTGGVARVQSVRCEPSRIIVNDARAVELWAPPRRSGAAGFNQGDVTTFLAKGKVPAAQSTTDTAGLASAAVEYDFDLAPGATCAFSVSSPFHRMPADAAPRLTPADADARFAELLERVRRMWSQELNQVELRLPASAAKLVNTFKTTQAYVLINADGPAIQPGSRTYERSWIRDGALTSTALLGTGHPAAVRSFLDWYAAQQFPSGKVPCVADRRGPDPVPEHDSTGELIYALLKYYRFTRDREFLAAHLPQVEAGVKYLAELRDQRITPEYKDGPPEKRACYGLVPESISHEGYSAKPMHSYWDSFFVLRGLRDATTIAEILGQRELQERFARLRDEYGQALAESVPLAIRTKQIDYVPGCVELGDFDATSTSIAVFPCAVDDVLPRRELSHTFDRYWDFFCQRRDGALAWENYTPYEIRVASTFIHLGQPERAHALLDFFFRDQRPMAWNQWAEVVWRDPATPKFIGDMPHTWVGSEFLNAVRNMFVYERERDSALVLAAGVRAEWLDSPGVNIVGFPTEYGRVSYELTRDGERLSLTLRHDGDVPPGGFVFLTPLAKSIAGATVDGAAVDTFHDRALLLKSPSARIVIRHAP